MCPLGPQLSVAQHSGARPSPVQTGEPFGLQAGTQSTEPHQPELNYVNFIFTSINLIKKIF